MAGFVEPFEEGRRKRVDRPWFVVREASRTDVVQRDLV